MYQNTLQTSVYQTSIKFTYESGCIKVICYSLNCYRYSICNNSIQPKLNHKTISAKERLRPTTCWHNSRVGTRMKAFGAGLRIRPSEDNFNRSCSNGRRQAKVFPEPVFAFATTSFPSWSHNIWLLIRVRNYRKKNVCT